jgi:hypothetical protein
MHKDIINIIMRNEHQSFVNSPILSFSDFTAQRCKAGLPDGIFSYQKSQFGHILEAFGIENVYTF